MENLRKDGMNILLAALLIIGSAFVTTSEHVLLATDTSGETKQSDDDVKNSIDEILNVDKYLFLSTDKPYVDAPVSYLINADTGQVLYDDDGDYQMDILSVSKVLSAYVILDMMRDQPEKYNWDTRIVADGSIVTLSYERNFSNVEMQEDEAYTIRELFDAMMIKSSNAATMLLGRQMFGGEKAFVAATRQKALDLNLKHTIMKTSTGLNKEDLLDYGYNDLEDGNNRMTAEDVAFLTMKITADYPEILEVTRKPKSTFGNLTDKIIEYETTNWLLPGFEHGYDGVTGFKTGADLMEYTSNVVFTAERNGIRLIGVILGAQNSKVRSDGAIALLDYGFNMVEHKHLITRDSVLFERGTVKVKYGSKRNVPVTVSEDFVLTTSYNDLKPNYIFVPTNAKYNAKYNAFEGAIKKGEVLGYITVQYTDLAFLTDNTKEHYGADVIAAEDVGNGFFLFNMIEWISDKIKTSFAGSVNVSRETFISHM